jgi:cell division protein FtsL
MTRRKDQHSSPAFMIFAIILAIAIAACGGVLHVYFKNRQIQVRRDIDAIDHRIDHCRLEIRTLEMRMDQLLNRYAIRKQLEENGSDLHPIALSVVEEMDPAPMRHRSVAAAAP